MTTPDAEFLRFAMLDGSAYETGQLRVSPLGSGFMFGEGLFETVRVLDSQPVLLTAHVTRLASSLRYFGAIPVSGLGELRERCRQVIAANALTCGNLKIIVFKDVGGWSEIILARATTYAKGRYEAGFRLVTTRCGERNDPLYGMKTLNYLPNIQAKRRAVAAGFDDSLFVDSRGLVLEGATTNVFVVKDRRVKTPSLVSHVLPGVMRATVIKLFTTPLVRECDITLDELRQADEVFVTNALLGIMPVALVDSLAYDLIGNSVTRELTSKLQNYLQERPESGATSSQAGATP